MSNSKKNVNISHWHTFPSDNEISIFVMHLEIGNYYVWRTHQNVVIFKMRSTWKKKRVKINEKKLGTHVGTYWKEFEEFHIDYTMGDSDC
jgi:hypothetical protein